MADKSILSAKTSAKTVKNALAADSTLPSEPYLHGGEGIRSLRAEWLVALLPICIWSIFVFGWGTLARELTAILCAVATDLLLHLWMRKRKNDSTIASFDLTTAVIALLAAFLLPYDCPIWLVGLTALLTAGVGALFGGMSACPLCLPALVIILVRTVFPALTDTALRFDSEGGRTVADLLAVGEKPSATIEDLLFGRIDGMIGEIGALLILLAAGYLIVRNQIGWHLPLAWLVGGALTAYLTAPETMSVYYYVIAQLCTGGFLLVGCLIAPNRMTSPTTPRAAMAVGLLGGVLTILFRKWLGVDGALLAALICSLPARPLDRLLAPFPFGGRIK